MGHGSLHALIIEDSDDDVMLLVHELRRGEYDVEYQRVETEEQMRAALNEKEWDIIFSDYTLPHFSGADALQVFKESGLDIPFIIVTGTIGEQTAVDIMKAGVHDYLMKGNLTRLIPAVKRELAEAKNRSLQRQADETLRLTQFTIDHVTQAIIWIDSSGTVVYANEAATQIAGMSRLQIMGSKVWKIEGYFSEDNWAEFWARIRQTNNLTFETEIKVSDGSARIVEVSTSYIQYHDKEYVVSLFHDITHRKQNEIELRESRQMLRTVIDAIPVRVFWKDKDLVYRGCNRAYAIDHGLETTEDVVGKVDSDLNPASDNTLFHENDRIVIHKAITLTDCEPYETLYSGEIIPIFTRKAPLIDTEGKVTGVLGIYEDISERKKTEEKLRESERRLKDMLESIQLIAIMLDIESKITFCNDYLLKLTGWNREEILGKNWFEIFTPVDQEIRDTFLKNQRFKENVKTYHENYILTRSGEKKLVSWNNTILRDPNGEMIGAASIGVDITDLNRYMDLLVQAKTEWESTFNTIDDLILITDAQGIIKRCNRAAIKRLGGNPEQVLDKKISQVFSGKPEMEKIFPHLKGEIRFPLVDGEFEIASYPLKLKNHIDHILYVIKDITLRKHIEESMLNTQRLADLGSLAAGIMHDLKSPLQIITGASESLLKMLAENRLDKDHLVRRLESINRNGWRIDEVMRSLLIYSRSMGSEPHPEEMNTIVRDTLLLLEHQLSVWANVSIQTDLTENLPLFTCERSSISQALANLILNARDAMPHGGKITIRTNYSPSEHEIILEVVDTGAGIPLEIQDKIFDAFFTTKPPDKGTGLGLSNVQSAVRSTGGHIRLKSKPGEGTSFTLHFPVD